MAKSGLQASLLVRHPETKELFVNFDPQILTLIRESECMVRLGLDIPFGAQTLLQKSQTIKKNYNRLQVNTDSPRRTINEKYKFNSETTLTRPPSWLENLVL